jgi:hypothetical protein
MVPNLAGVPTATRASPIVAAPGGLGARPAGGTGCMAKVARPEAPYDGRLSVFYMNPSPILA